MTYKTCALTDWQWQWIQLPLPAARAQLSDVKTRQGDFLPTQNNRFGPVIEFGFEPNGQSQS
jgi:hypothetical protein